MTTEHLTRGLQEIVAAVLEMDPDEIEPDAAFYDVLGASSLEKAEIVDRIGQWLELPFSASEASAMTSIDDTMGILARRSALPEHPLPPGCAP